MLVPVGGNFVERGRHLPQAPHSSETQGGRPRVHKRVRSSDRLSRTSVPLCKRPRMARSRQATVESYSGASVFTTETRMPAVCSRKRPVMTPSGRTKKLGQQLSQAEELGQLIHM